MVNVTYSEVCECSIASMMAPRPTTLFYIAGDLNYVDDAGDSVVYNLGDIAWVLASTALVWLMIPGLGFFYSGLLRRKNALSMIWTSMVAIGVVSFQVCNPCPLFSPTPLPQPLVTFQWFFWGYSLAFSETGSAYIGNLSEHTLLLRLRLLINHDPIEYIALKGVLAEPSMGSTRIPAIVFCVYQLMFAAITPAIAIGAVAERGRLGPLLVFIFVWSTLVYDPIACWTWSANGWSFVLGGLDFAGGTPVHISSGTAALAISIFLGKRPASVAFGFLGATACNFATQLKFIAGYDDTLDIFASHAIGGVVGNILTALFAQSSVAGFDGFTVIPGGWFDHHYIQLGYQLADSVAGLSYSFVMTTIILWIMHFIPGLSLRSNEETEILGVDDAEMGEFAYDYVGLEQELGHATDAGVGAIGGAREPEHGEHKHITPSVSTHSNEKAPAEVSTSQAA
ncbi:hypothetical protein H0H87_005700 [Tephrocybe sp. NHM501043]|nr:hypothetical protein H0H87_005700 [Tephrocybe sp. NHM501043]